MERAYAARCGPIGHLSLHLHMNGLAGVGIALVMGVKHFSLFGFLVMVGCNTVDLEADLDSSSFELEQEPAELKAFARALRIAATIDPRQKGVPSTKGSLAD